MVPAWCARIRSGQRFNSKHNSLPRSSAYINAINSKGAVVFTSQNKFRGTAYTDDRYYDNDIVVYRLGEVKLLKAELLCYLGGDNVQKAIDAMFATRNRAGIGAYTGSTVQKVVQKAISDGETEHTRDVRLWS